MTIWVNPNFIPRRNAQIPGQLGRQDNISVFINLGVVVFLAYKGLYPDLQRNAL